MDPSTSKTDDTTVMGRFDIALHELVSSFSTIAADDNNSESSAGVKAIKLMMPMMLKKLRSADEATVSKLTMTFAERMYWVAKGKKISDDQHVESAGDAERDSVAKDAAGPDNWSIGVGEVDSVGVSDSPVCDGLSQVEDSSSGHKATVQGGVDGDRDASGESVQKVGSRRASRKLNVAAVEFGPIEKPA